ncbi:MAG: acylphosphatase [Bacillota bacterium]
MSEDKNNEEKVRKHVYITGRVQGVGFRAFTRRNASQFGVKGWVKNLFDGRVEAVLSGGKDDVGQMINKLRQGPSMAMVQDIEVKDEEYQNQFSRFQIKY